MKPKKLKGKSYYDCWELYSWFKEHKNIDIEPYITEVYRNECGGNGVLLTLFLGDKIEEDDCEAEKIMKEVFKKEIEVKFWW